MPLRSRYLASKTILHVSGVTFVNISQWLVEPPQIYMGIEESIGKPSTNFLKCMYSQIISSTFMISCFS
jgi:hypothetical protein